MKIGSRLLRSGSFISALFLGLMLLGYFSVAIAQTENNEETQSNDLEIELPDPEELSRDEADAERNGSDDTLVAEEHELPEIIRDLSRLPFPTRRMHELILEATKSGDIDKLRAYIGTGETMTLLSLGGVEGDPIEFLKEQSGDEKGHEILAILEEVLEAGFVHLDEGTEQELYVWPYFFAYPINNLEARQMVELFRIVTYGDFQDMTDFGGYIFYRVGITPTGRWQFFVAGD